MGSYTLAGGPITEDDDIQFLYQASPMAFSCQFCYKDLSKMDEQQRQVHYDRHFLTDGSHIEKNDRKMGEKLRDWIPKRTEDDVFWFPTQAKPPPSNFSPGLIPVLRKALIKSHAKGRTQRAVLCYDKTVHVSREIWDAYWGCGYRNYVMACTALMDQPVQPMYFPLLDDPFSPGVRNLQRTIEAAWKDGYDTVGARDMGNKLVGTKKWIGTAELYTAFSYRRIPAGLVDFEHKDQDKVVKLVTDWVVQYFSPSVVSDVKVSIDVALRGASPVTSTDKMPLILQYSGHSGTIVGYEVSRTGAINLLTFDPSRAVKKSMRNAGLASISSTFTPSPPHNGQSSAHTSVIQKILQPIQKNKRREIEDASSNDNRTKRARSTGPKENMSDNEVIIVDGPLERRPINLVPKHQEEQRTLYSPEDRLDPFETINCFRLNPKTLGRRKRYQILYFPLSDPLTPTEQFSRKEVHSTKIC